MKKISYLLALLISAAGVMNTSVSLAAGPKPTANEKSPAQSSKKLAQAPLECLQLSFSVRGVIHNSILFMNGSYGVMLTEFYSPALGGSTTVQQSMVLTNIPEGLLIAGFDPVYPQTTRPYPNYSPDNFLLNVAPNGDITAVNCDNNRVCVPVRVSSCR
jgi:hypothetical protein